MNFYFRESQNDKLIIFLSPPDHIHPYSMDCTGVCARSPEERRVPPPSFPPPRSYTRCSSEYACSTADDSLPAPTRNGRARGIADTSGRER